MLSENYCCWRVGGPQCETLGKNVKGEAGVFGEAVSAKDSRSVLELFPPFPIVLVTTRENVITINQVAYLTFSPLRIGIGVAHARYTYSLLKKEGEFVVNIPDASLVDEVKLCGSLSGRNQDKFEAAGLKRRESSQVCAAGIVECAAQIECRVTNEIPFEKRTWFVGDVVAAWKRKDHDPRKALMCDRYEYAVPGVRVAER